MLFYLKKQKNYTSGLAPVYLRITVDGQRAEVTTNRECEPEKWNSHSGRAIETKVIKEKACGNSLGFLQKKLTLLMLCQHLCRRRCTHWCYEPRSLCS